VKRERETETETEREDGRQKVRKKEIKNRIKYDRLGERDRGWSRDPLGGKKLLRTSIRRLRRNSS